MSDDKIPARPELTVLPADPPQESKLGFMVREYNGTEVFLRGKIGTPLKNLADLLPGVEVLVPSLFGGYNVMTVGKDEYGVFYAKNEALYANLEFSIDERKCWTSSMAFNLRAVKKLTK